MLATVCFFGGPLVNKMGVKWALVVGAATFPIRGASYYCNSKFGNQWVSASTSCRASSTACTCRSLTFCAHIKRHSSSSLAASSTAPAPAAGTWRKPGPSSRWRLPAFAESTWRSGSSPGIWDNSSGEVSSENFSWTIWTPQNHAVRTDDVYLLVQRSLAKNHTEDGSGGVTPDTYIAFLIIECLACVDPIVSTLPSLLSCQHLC